MGRLARVVVLVLSLAASLLVMPVAQASDKELAFTGGPMDFGTVPVYFATPEKTLTVTNTGTQPVALTGTEVVSAQAHVPFQVTGSTCTTSLAPTRSCTIELNFYSDQPVSGATSWQAELVVSSDAAGAPFRTDLTGVTTTQRAGVWPPAVEFPGQVLDTTSPAQTITVTNVSENPLLVSVDIEGADAGDFASVDNCLAGALAPNSTCEMSVTFHPSVPGVKNADVKVTTDDPDYPTVLVPLSGQGGVAVTSVSAASLAFGDHLVGSTSSPREITVTNTGTFELSFASIGIVGAQASQFARTTTCAANLPPAGSCTVAVSFSPTSAAAASATLRILSSGTAGPLDVDLSGTGTRRELVVEPRVAFGDQEVGTKGQRVVHLRNEGTAQVTVTGVSVAGADPFSASHACSVIPSSGSCPVTVDFAPSGLATYTATLTVRSDDGDRSVALSGTGTRAEVALSPGSLDFGTLPIGSVSPASALTVRNPGTAPLKVTGTSLTGADAARFTVSTGCSIVAPGDRCQINVRFSPTDPGPRQATLNVETNRATVPVTLQGNSAGAIVAAQEPVRALKLAKKLKRTPTQLLRVPVRTNADQVAGISITPQKRVYVRSDQRWVYAQVLGKRPARITVRISAPAVPGYSAYSFKKIYKVKRAR